ncbi:oxidoreductase [Pseudoalteromonas sp. J010]|uniref:complex I subunit 5 family protein n=1 Tax=Pseudoalteromonas sp. J010 TaxID=998465 RepID=UPI000F6553BE|nr:proton-conducting transporter membrane subunit [Pseudoalteromonas sp. J010]RRS08186.1 oxidoreductase [Pseudoalteromonas sp. J010]
MNSSAESIIPILILLPLIASLCSFLCRTHLIQTVICFLTVFGLCLTVAQLHIDTVENIEALKYVVGGWAAPLGIEFSLDGLSILMVTLCAFLIAILSFYGTFYFKNKPTERKFWPLWWLLVSGINALFISSDLFNIYVTLEIIGLASVALVALSESKEGLIAALRYLFVGLLGSLLYLAGVALIYYSYGTLEFSALSEQVEKSSLNQISLVLVSLGLALKTAIVPLHFWLPYAHSNAPAPVSAILSGLVVKASFYLLIRFWMEILSPIASNSALYLMGLLGAGAIFWGCFKALKAKRLKIMIAYSTVAQIGYLFLLFPMLATSTLATDTKEIHQEVLAAIAYFIVAHACAKSAMFIAAGNIITVLGHDNISQLQGMAKYIPISLFTFAIAGCSLIGLPPSAGFIAKWLLLNSAIDTGQWWWIVIVVVGGLLAALALFRVLDLAFIKKESKVEPASVINSHKISPYMLYSGLFLALCTIALGFNAELIIDLVLSGGGE